MADSPLRCLLAPMAFAIDLHDAAVMHQPVHLFGDD
jgi:hypothetical protein